MFCNKCGHILEKNSKFCSSCGANVVTSEDDIKPVATDSKLEKITQDNDLNPYHTPHSRVTNAIDDVPPMEIEKTSEPWFPFKTAMTLTLIYTILHVAILNVHYLDNIGYNLGTSIGFFFTISMISAIPIVMYQLIIKRPAPFAKNLLIVVGLLAIVGMNEEMQNRQNPDVQKIKSTIEDISENKNLDKKLIENNDVNILINFLKSIATESATLQAEYEADLENAGWMTILDSNRLDKDRTMEKNYAIAERSRSIINHYRNKNYEILDYDKIIRKVNSLNISNANKIGFEEGFKNNHPKSVTLMNKLWDSEQQLVDEVIKILDLLKTAEWELQEGQMVFYTDAALNTYNNQLNAINEIIIVQESIEKERKDMVTKNF